MKHNFFRRLSALALAWVLAASLCLTPAWAADGDGTGTATPPSGALQFSTRVIVLKDSKETYQLNIKGLSQDERIKLTPKNGATVDGKAEAHEVEITDSGTTEITVPVGTSIDVVKNGQIEVTRTLAGGNDDVSYTCYVFSGYAPFTYTPAELTRVKVGETITLRVTVDSAYSEFFREEDVKFTSLENYLKVTTSKSGSTFTVAIQGVNELQGGTVPVTMTLTGGYQKRWDIGVDPAPGTIPVDSVRITPNYLKMAAGSSRDALTAKVEPENATNKTVTWYSENPDIVEVDEDTGKITAKAAGRTKIYAEAGGKRSNDCVVVVSAAPSSVKLDNTALTLDLTVSGQGSKTLTATAEPAQNAAFSWSTSDPAVADFNSSNTASSKTVTITGKKEGTARIMVTATITEANGNKVTRSAYCDVTVVDANSAPVDRLTLSETSHSMPEDGSFKLSVTSFTPANALDKTVRWESSNPAIASVNENTGEVTAHKAGKVTITATARFGGANDFCDVTVTPKTEIINLSFNFDSNSPVGSNKYTYTFKGNDYITVNAVLNPTGAADPVRWTSENSSIAAVSSGTGTRATVTEKGPGKTKIKAVPMDPSGKDRVGVDPAEITVTVSGIIIKRSEGNSAVTSLSLAQSRRETIVAEAFGSANNGSNSVDWTSSDPAIVSVSTKSGESTAITARKPGTAVITARKGTYTATCTVTVMEDTAGVINASTPAATAYQFSKLASQLQAACRNKTGKELSYITNLAVSSTDQGILHDQHHSSEDTGAGVGIQDRYYPGTAPQGQRSLNDLSFVPKNTFSGTAEISYTGWTTDNQSFSGVIRISVNGTGDVTYSSNDGSAVTFSAEDFNFYHPNLKSVSFTPPQDSVGTLYYNYTSASQPGTKVTAGATYNRTSNPSIDRVSFVPAAGYEGTVKIAYKGTDTGGKSFTGTVTITVTKGDGSGGNPADISYSVKEDSWLTLRPSDFNTASLRTLGESLSYVRFTPPASSDGTLFYNYRGFSDFDSMVNNTTSYYYSGSPSLSGVSFVPITTTPGQVDINYTGYTTRGNTFEGTIHISLNDLPQEQQLLHYTVFTGKTVNLNAGDFNTACAAATGSNLASVQFTSLPGVSQGTLRYTRGSSSTSYNVTTGTRFFRTGTGSTANLIGNVYFQAASNYTGTVTIPFTGTGENGKTFTDEVVITVTPPQASDVTYSGTTASPIRLYASQIQSANRDVLSNVSYITFTSLPSSTAGKLYTGYNGFGTGTQVSTGTRYYVSGYPSIDQISFVPRGRYTGQVSVGYTATSTSGESVSGRIVFSISSTGGSSYFYDMGYHAWAAPSVDYLYQNGVTNGVTATSFGPNQQILRGDFVLMLCRAFNFNGANGYSFADVPTNSYFSQAVATAKQMGIVNGDGGNFRPYSPITRQDAMVIIKNALDAAGWNVGNASSSVLNRFSDGASVSNYAVNAVSTLVQLGAVNGDNGRLLPHNSITRAEAAVILHFVMTM